MSPQYSNLAGYAVGAEYLASESAELRPSRGGVGRTEGPGESIAAQPKLWGLFETFRLIRNQGVGEMSVKNC